MTGSALTLSSPLPYPQQVVYILDQVRALEREMQTRLEEAGLEVRGPAGLGRQLSLACAAW